MRKVIGREQLVESLQDLMVLPQVSLTLTSVVNAVLLYGSDRWYELAVAMGFRDAEINNVSFDKPSSSGKLLAIIRLMGNRVGQKRTEKLLLKACKEIHRPIYGYVSSDLRDDALLDA